MNDLDRLERLEKEVSDAITSGYLASIVLCIAMFFVGKKTMSELFWTSFGILVSTASLAIMAQHRK